MPCPAGAHSALLKLSTPALGPIALRYHLQLRQTPLRTLCMLARAGSCCARPLATPARPHRSHRRPRTPGSMTEQQPGSTAAAATAAAATPSAAQAIEFLTLLQHLKVVGRLRMALWY